MKADNSANAARTEQFKRDLKSAEQSIENAQSLLHRKYMNV
jgi:hypothetical protein